MKLLSMDDIDRSICDAVDGRDRDLDLLRFFYTDWQDIFQSKTCEYGRRTVVLRGIGLRCHEGRCLGVHRMMMILGFNTTLWPLKKYKRVPIRAATRLG